MNTLLQISRPLFPRSSVRFTLTEVFQPLKYQNSRYSSVTLSTVEECSPSGSETSCDKKENRIVKMLESTLPLEKLLSRNYKLNAWHMFFKFYDRYNKDECGKLATTTDLRLLHRQFDELSLDAKQEYIEAAAWFNNYRKNALQSLSHVICKGRRPNAANVFTQAMGVCFPNVRNDAERLFTENCFRTWNTEMTVENKEENSDEKINVVQTADGFPSNNLETKEQSGNGLFGPYYRRSEELVQDYIDDVSSLNARQLSALKILLRQAEESRILMHIVEQLPQAKVLRELIEVLFDAPKYPVDPMLLFYCHQSVDTLSGKESYQEKLHQYHSDFKAWEKKMVKSGHAAELQLYRLASSKSWRNKLQQWARHILRKYRVNVLNKLGEEYKRPHWKQGVARKLKCIKFTDTAPGRNLAFRKSEAYFAVLKPQLEKWETFMNSTQNHRIVHLFTAAEFSRDWIQLAKEFNVFCPIFTVGGAVKGEQALRCKLPWKLVNIELLQAARIVSHRQRWLATKERFLHNRPPFSPFRRLLTDQLRNKKPVDERLMALKQAKMIWRSLSRHDKQNLMTGYKETLSRWHAWKSEKTEQRRLKKLRNLEKKRQMRSEES